MSLFFISEALPLDYSVLMSSAWQLSALNSPLPSPCLSSSFYHSTRRLLCLPNNSGIVLWPYLYLDSVSGFPFWNMPHLYSLNQISWSDFSPQIYLSDPNGCYSLGPKVSLWVCPALTGLWGLLWLIYMRTNTMTDMYKELNS